MLSKGVCIDRRHFLGHYRHNYRPTIEVQVLNDDMDGCIDGWIAPRYHKLATFQGGRCGQTPVVYGNDVCCSQ